MITVDKETDMDLRLFYTGPMQVNTYLCVDKETKKGFIVDPGGGSPTLEKYISENGYEIEYIVVTHGHGDHICGVPHYSALYEAPIVGNSADNFYFNDARLNQSRAFTGRPVEFTPDIDIKDGETLQVGGMTLQFMETPGHSPGSISVLVDNILFSGDTLFQLSIGRTDFEGGSFSDLKESVHTKIFTLPDDTFVLPGHMGQTQVGYEKKHNPFVALG